MTVPHSDQWGTAYGGFRRLREVLSRRRGWEGVHPNGPGLRPDTEPWEVDRILARAEEDLERLSDAARSLSAELDQRIEEVAELEHERNRWLGLCAMVDAHYSGSLDHRPRYVQFIRTALTDVQAVLDGRAASDETGLGPEENR